MSVKLFRYLELYDSRSCRKACESRGRILEVKNLCVVIVSRIHSFQIRVVLQHVSLCLAPLITDKLARQPKPSACFPVEAAKLHLRIFLNLLRDVLV